MKLKEGFITYDSGDEHLMVAAGPAAKLFHGMVRSNDSAAFILNALKKDTTPAAIAAAMAQEYDAPLEVLQKDVDKVLAQLRGIGALDD